MTKKDYKLIATAIWRAGYLEDKNKIRQQAKMDARRLIAINIATDLKQDNPRFNRDKFMEACGLGSEKTEKVKAQKN